MKILAKLYKFCSSWTGTFIIVFIVIFFIAQAFVIPSGSMKNTLLVGDFLFAKKFVYGIPTPHIPWLEIPVLPDFNNNGHLIEGNRPKRGEIVIFRNPENTKIHFVKRLFAVGGDEVIFDFKNMYLRPHEGDDFIDKNYDKKDIVILDGKKFVREPYKFKGIHYDEKVDMVSATLNYLKINKFYMQPLTVSEISQDLTNKIEFNAYYAKIANDEFFMVGDNRNNSNDSRFWGPVPYKLIVGKPWFVYFSWNSKKEIRWERIGRFVDTLQNDERFIYEQD